MEPFAYKQKVQVANRVSPHSASAPGAIRACQAPRSFPKLPSTWSLQRGCFFARPLLVQQSREKLSREDWRIQGALGELLWTTGILQSPRGPIVYVLLYLYSMGRGSIHLLWPTCKVAAEHSWIHPVSPFPPKEREQTGATLVDQCPSHLRQRLSSYQLAKITQHT